MGTRNPVHVNICYLRRHGHLSQVEGVQGDDVDSILFLRESVRVPQLKTVHRSKVGGRTTFHLIKTTITTSVMVPQPYVVKTKDNI